MLMRGWWSRRREWGEGRLGRIGAQCGPPSSGKGEGRALKGSRRRERRIEEGGSGLDVKGVGVCVCVGDRRGPSAF